MNRRTFLASVLALVVAGKNGIRKPLLCKCGKPMGAHRPMDVQRDYIQPAVDKLLAKTDARAFEAIYGAMRGGIA